MAGMDQILYVGIVGVGLYLAWTTGVLDQAGQALVNATTPKQGFAKKRGRGEKHVEILEEPLVYPFKPKLTRLTIA